jgi:hypothetical protein
VSKASVDDLNALHGLVARELAKKIRSGEATAADYSVATKFLKDNHIEQLAVAGSPMADLISSLPFPSMGIEH